MAEVISQSPLPVVLPSMALVTKRKLPSKNIEESIENIEESAVSKRVKPLKAKLDKDKAILADEEIKDAC